jgi:DNA-binding CsgD family transcriptional regulator
MPLYGRDAERAALGALAEAARQSRSGVLIIRGAPGTGKSALLDDVAAGSADMRVLRATGIQVEAELAFAGLHQLVWPLRNLIGQLTGAQAALLRGVLGAAQDPPPGQFQVGAATLELLAAAAEDRPLLALVDDAHWLDGPSAEAIIFAARRLHADPVAVVLAIRDGPQTAFDGSGFTERHLRGLDIRAAGALLDSSGPLEPSVRSEVLRIADGNPLALLELPRALASEQPGGEPLGQPVALTRALTPALEDAFLARVRALPTPSQRLLLLAAADSTADPAVVLPAARHLGIAAGDIDAAEAAGLLRLTATEVSFRHPLVRSAVYQSAPFSERAQVHRALARTSDPDRRAWHQAAALAGPDDTVADALEESAVRARARSGFGAAAAALQRSASLTADSGARARRLAAAAEAAWLAGRPAPAAALLRQARELAADPKVAADIEYTQALIEMADAVPADAYARLTRAAATVEAADPGRAQKLLLQAREAAYLSADPRAEAEVSRQAADLAAAQAGDLFAAAFLDGFARWLGPDPGSAVPRLRQAMDLAEQSADPRRLFWAGIAAFTLGDDERARHFFGQETARARSEGSVAMVAQALTMLSATESLQGHGASARATAAEGLELAQATGQRNIACFHLAHLARVAASFGTEDETRSLVTQFNQATANHRLPPFENLITVALGEMELAHGNAERALAHLSEVAAAGLRSSDPLNRVVAVPSYAEASIRAGRPDLAASAAASFGRWAATTRSVPDLALHARLLALLAPADAADPHFAEALRLHLTAQRQFDRARTELLYGESLRRRRERLRAREHLRVALDLFERLGAHPWAGRARAELRATGETARLREPGLTEQLTPRELQVARFIAAGASTRQAASQMFLSPRTIDAHLRSIYAKFGITSRTELRAADLGEITHNAAQ